MEKNQAETFIQWFGDRMAKRQSLTFGDVSKVFDCTFEYVDDDVFLHFQDESKVVFQYDREETYYPLNATLGF